MRLINTQSMQLEEFFGPYDLPPYAVLSHTWGDAEVTYQEMTSQHKSALLRTEGFRKIHETCRVARGNELHYVWVDTCCIDKTSSAELTEAINSMFQWYTSAAVCYAYLHDFSAGDSSDIEPALRACRWFTRGWTLQELLAPPQVEFFDKEWRSIGSKSKLAPLIQRITTIGEDVLVGETALSQLSVAKRMSWAADRNTTRLEDAAYCLLGIFNVNMPLVYGEGTRAFQRLQEEIIKQSNDFSIFAWRAATPRAYGGLLAASPSEFKDCFDVQIDEGALLSNPEYSVTNKGIKMETELIGNVDGSYLLNLRCFRPQSGDVPLLLLLRQVHKNVFLRAKPAEFSSILPTPDASRQWFETVQTLYAMKHVTESLASSLGPEYSIPFVFRKGFTEYSESWEVEKLSAEMGVYCEWHAATDCVDHQYNRDRTLRPFFPRFGKATCLVTITTHYQTGYTAVDPTSHEKVTLYVWMGMYSEGKPWVYCSFQDEPDASVLGIDRLTLKGGPRKSSTQTSLLAINEDDPARPAHRRRAEEPTRAKPNTGNPANLVLGLQLVDGGIGGNQVVFIDMARIQRTRMPVHL